MLGPSHPDTSVRCAISLVLFVYCPIKLPAVTLGRCFHWLRCKHFLEPRVIRHCEEAQMQAALPRALRAKRSCRQR